ncbi:MAG TPA: endoribonuclease MazF [Candidatus Paceibacterota bacterium]|nr:endoribonuclease MazF [Candidatus Paceibacterota bacterium]
MVTDYIPDRGDILWIDFAPTKGHEQSGRRPAIVISRRVYNKNAELVLVCPITSVSKRYPYEVRLIGAKITGVVLSDQVRSIDWKARRAEFAERAPSEIIDDVEAKLLTLIQS